MAISNELSSEIAAAMLAQKKSPQELKKLSEIVLQVHNALQKMSQHAAAERLKAKAKQTTSTDYTDFTD
jgi:predicted transcriptional regulator